MSPNSAVQKKFAQPSMLLAPCVALTVGLAAAVPQRAARGDVVTDWNEIAINTTAAPTPPCNRACSRSPTWRCTTRPAPLIRAQTYAVDIKAPAGASIDAAVAAAAHGALVRLVPAQRAMLDDALNVALAKSRCESES